ncbi:MAG: hypothetical protein GYA39_04285 [Methanothrix sp.]|nr:hypothetical protein [Methanothrix sp.]
MISFFLLQSFFTLALDSFLLYVKLWWKEDLQNVFPMLAFSDLIGLVSATLAASIVIAAIMKMRKNRLVGYMLFKDAVLVQIFLVQVFLFYKAQFLAFLGLAGNICVLLVLYYMIQQQKAAQGICTETLKN